MGLKQVSLAAQTRQTKMVCTHAECKYDIHLGQAMYGDVSK